HMLTVNHIDRSGLPDRHVQELARGVEPDSIRLAADWQAGYLLIPSEIEHNNRSGVAGDERTIRACIEVQSVRTSAGYRDLRGYCGCAAAKRDDDRRPAPVAEKSSRSRVHDAPAWPTKQVGVSGG